MSREIKFRAWDSESKKWFPFDGNGWFNIHQNGEIIHGHNDEPCFDETDCNLSLEVVQFTCLRDKNGKEIYEGDVVAKHGGMEWESICCVRWFQEKCAFWLVLPKDRYWLDLCDLRTDDIEVIGNIYENPELLK